MAQGDHGSPACPRGFRKARTAHASGPPVAASYTTRRDTTDYHAALANAIAWLEPPKPKRGQGAGRKRAGAQP